MELQEAKPCPSCGADWRRTELVSEAHHGGGYHVLCHECGHEWDDPGASHGARDEFRGYATQEGLFTGDFREKPIETVRLKYIVLNADPRTGDMQRDIYKLLEGLMSVPGLIKSPNFGMSMGEPSLETNEVTIRLEFDQGEEDARGTDQLDEGDHNHGEESPDAGEPVVD